jgi:sulfur-carrier protein
MKVLIPPPLREQANGQLEVPVSGATVRDALAELFRQCPALEAKVFDKDRVRPHINVLVNDEDIRYLDELDTAVGEGNVILLMPAVAGG